MDEMSKEFLFENHVYKSLSCILKNMTDLLFLVEQNLTATYPHGDANETIMEAEIIKQRITEHEVNDLSENVWLSIQIFAVLGMTWLFDRHVMKTSFVRTWTEAILAWWMVIMVLPILIPAAIVLLTVRTALTLKFKFKDGGKFQLMNPFDAVWSFENPYSTSTCNGLYVIKGQTELSRIRDLLQVRVIEKMDSNATRVYDRFRWSIVKKYGFACWNKDTSSFNIDDHIRYCKNEDNHTQSEWNEEEVFSIAAKLHDISLNQPGKSPWEILLIPKFKIKDGKPGNHYAILFRIHHAIGDGISMGHILHQCIADEPFVLSVDPIAPLKISKFTIWLSYIFSFLLLPQITIRNIFFQEENAFHTEKTLTGPKTMNWSRPICLTAVKELKNKSNTSVFTVLLSCLTGAMRNLYKKHGHPIPDIIHAAPPIAILPYPDRRPRNRFSVVLYPLATGKESATDRLQAVFKASKKLASSPDVFSNFYVIYIMGLLPYALIEIFASLAHATLSFSNIPGPTNMVKVLNGDELVEIGAWIPVKNRIGISMGLFSYNDKFRVTFIADKVCLPNSDDVDLLRDYFETELMTLAQSLDISSKTNIFI